MLKGGVIMDVTNAEQAKIAEDAGAVAVMALERIPADIRADGGVARMSNPHLAEAQVLKALGVDFIDESEVITPADEVNHIWKHDFKIPFVCGCRDLGEALRRISEGAAMIRTKGEAGSGNIVEAVRHMRKVQSDIKKIQTLDNAEIVSFAKNLGAAVEMVQYVKENGKLPVPNFAAGGVATPADASLMMQLGAETVFVGSGIFKSSDPEARAKAIVLATTHFNDPDSVLKASEKLGDAMHGLEISTIPEGELLQNRGW